MLPDCLIEVDFYRESENPMFCIGSNVFLVMRIQTVVNQNLQKLSPSYDYFFFANFEVLWVLDTSGDLKTVQQDIVTLARVLQKIFLQPEGVVAKPSQSN